MFVEETLGILKFSPSGTAEGYVLTSSTFYCNNIRGSDPDPQDSTVDGEPSVSTIDLDFATIWFSK